MKKIGLAGIIAGAFTAAVVGLAGPAQAEATVHMLPQAPGGIYYDNDNDYYPWRDQLFPTVKVPQVDTSVRH
ncbi:hypothetical protein [Mycolicibacterium bacteremicum]|uniref:Uncharacterized protein n=1 Tax=Mycolicibacterium bacteremicum TaxID=564198 RepID=A0A1W9YT91_MYCBA|nr:hypothetical protein [Mycolicibacterium bacteremicum]MCV7432931.1 hypothetical protein [Mycolicibacterium bacteremicum]ORA03274.1 hypothetical protein BST17_19355 [Mycolicibacterium bacteremicum]